MDRVRGTGFRRNSSSISKRRRWPVELATCGSAAPSAGRALGEVEGERIIRRAFHQEAGQPRLRETTLPYKLAAGTSQLPVSWPTPNPPKRDVRVVDTRDDGQGKANGPSQIPIDGDEGGVRAAPLARCWRPCGHGGGNSAGGRQEVPLADRVGASWRRCSVGRMAGQWETGAVRLGVAGRAIVPGRH